MKKARRKKLLIALSVVLAGLIIVCGILIVTKNSSEKNEPNNISQEDISYPIVLSEELELIELSAATGNYPEDGSDDFLENVLSAKFLNKSDKTLQYATVNIEINGEQYSFAFSTIPPGESVIAYDMEKKAAPEKLSDCNAQAEYIVYFPEEPELYEEQLEFSVEDGYVGVKNISDETIDKEISVYYKNLAGDVYLGGITYRLRIPAGLKAGETVQAATTHMAKEISKVMFVTYGN